MREQLKASTEYGTNIQPNLNSDQTPVSGIGVKSPHVERRDHSEDKGDFVDST